jgi:hypothetical protein
MNLEKAVETADDADDADGKGLEVKRPRTFEGTPKPSMDWVVQSLHLRNRRRRRLNELLALARVLARPKSRSFRVESSSNPGQFYHLSHEEGDVTCTDSEPDADAEGMGAKLGTPRWLVGTLAPPMSRGSDVLVAQLHGSRKQQTGWAGWTGWEESPRHRRRSSDPIREGVVTGWGRLGN